MKYGYFEGILDLAFLLGMRYINRRFGKFIKLREI